MQPTRARDESHLVENVERANGAASRASGRRALRTLRPARRPARRAPLLRRRSYGGRREAADVRAPDESAVEQRVEVRVTDRGWWAAQSTSAMSHAAPGAAELADVRGRGDVDRNRLNVDLEPDLGEMLLRRAERQREAGPKLLVYITALPPRRLPRASSLRSREIGARERVDIGVAEARHDRGRYWSVSRSLEAPPAAAERMAVEREIDRLAQLGLSRKRGLEELKSEEPDRQPALDEEPRALDSERRRQRE